MSWRRIVTVLAFAMIVVGPAWAGSLGVYGSYWDSEEADSSAGGGGRVGFAFVKFLEVEFRGTYYPSFNTDVMGMNVDVKAKPLDGGLRFNLLPSGPLNPYVGAGVTYYFLSADGGDIEDKTGIYGEAGLELGANRRKFFIEALWRKMDTTISLAAFNRRTDFDGVAFNTGLVWRWGS